MSEGPGGPQGATAGGTLAMRMLSQQAMVASQMKRAANDKAIAQMLASKKSGPPAARLGDEIQHKSFLGALAGAVLGAIVTIAEGCLIMAACASGLHILCAYACRHGTCSMTPQQENALRSIARQANSEIKKARQQFPDKNVDDICRSVLKKHRETVTLMGFTPTHLSLAIGMLNGVFKER